MGEVGYIKRFDSWTSPVMSRGLSSGQIRNKGEVMWEEILVLEKGYSLYKYVGGEKPFFICRELKPNGLCGGYYKMSAALAAKGF